MDFTEKFDQIAEVSVKWLGSITAVVLSFAITAVWGALGPYYDFSDTWQLVCNTATTIITFWMVFIIQYSQNKDAAAMQAKLDELIRAVAEARNEFIGLDHRTAQEIEAVRQADGGNQ